MLTISNGDGKSSSTVIASLLSSCQQSTEYRSLGVIDEDIAVLTNFEDVTPEVSAFKKFLAAHKSRLTSRKEYRENVYPHIIDDIVKSIAYRNDVLKFQGASKTRNNQLQNESFKGQELSEGRSENSSRLENETSENSRCLHKKKTTHKYERSHVQASVPPKHFNELKDTQKPLWIRRWSAWIEPSWHSKTRLDDSGLEHEGTTRSRAIHLDDSGSTLSSSPIKHQDPILETGTNGKKCLKTAAATPLHINSFNKHPETFTEASSFNKKLSDFPSLPTSSPPIQSVSILDRESAVARRGNVDHNPASATSRSARPVSVENFICKTESLPTVNQEYSESMPFKKIRRRRLGRSVSLAYTPSRAAVAALQPLRNHTHSPRSKTLIQGKPESTTLPSKVEVSKNLPVPPNPNPFQQCIWSDIETDIEITEDNGVDTDTDVEGRQATRCFVLEPFDGLPHPFWGTDVEQSSWVSIPNPAKLDPECKVLRMLKALKPDTWKYCNSSLLVRHYKAFLKYGMFPEMLFEIWGRNKQHKPYSFSESEQRMLFSRAENVASSLSPGPVELETIRKRILELRRSIQTAMLKEGFIISQDDISLIDLPCPVDPTWRNVYSSRGKILKHPAKMSLAHIKNFTTNDEELPNIATSPKKNKNATESKLQKNKIHHSLSETGDETTHNRQQALSQYKKNPYFTKEQKSTNTSSSPLTENLSPVSSSVEAEKTQKKLTCQLAQLRCSSSPVQLAEYVNKKKKKNITYFADKRYFFADPCDLQRKPVTKKRLMKELKNKLIQRPRLQCRRGRRFLTRLTEVLREGEAWIRFHQIRDIKTTFDRLKLPPPPAPNPMLLCYSNNRRSTENEHAELPSFIPTIFRGPSRYEYIQDVLLQTLWSAKNASVPLATPKTSNLKLWIGGFMIPHDEKRFRYGDDAWFGSEPLMCLGVCDGVGEMSDTLWRVAGFDCRGFGEDILREAKSRVQTIRSARSAVPCSRPRLVLPTHARRSDKTWTQVPFSVNSAVSPPSLLALEAVVSGFYNKTTTWGAATCLFGCLNDSGTMIGFANIGDSKATILRRGHQFSTEPLNIVGSTKPEQHGWNLPVQLARLPDRSKVRSMREDPRLKELVSTLDSCRATGQDINDFAESATLYDFNIQEGDLILVASDGLWDNVFDDEVGALCGISLSPFESDLLCGTPFMSTAPRDIAKGLCLTAYWRTLQNSVETPFSQSVREAGGTGFDLGGKPDDITVVAAWVVPEHYENNQDLLLRCQKDWHEVQDLLK